ncbi:MAG: hypothetical protein K0Q53_87 [Massilibacillus sp.]|jgi:hypothetical protein|nr:hypothetical protein [Massilibacillus sp.]
MKVYVVTKNWECECGSPQAVFGNNKKAEAYKKTEELDNPQEYCKDGCVWLNIDEFEVQ